MSNPTFFYFYAPTWDFPPGGPIKLGNVITSIKKPEQPLYTAPLPTDSQVFSSEKSHVEYSKEKSRGGKFSILTKFLSILGVGVDLGANWDKRYNVLKSLIPLSLSFAITCISLTPSPCISLPTRSRNLTTNNSNDDLYVFDRVDTTQFIAKEEYLQTCIEATPVRRYLDKSRYRKPLYIITGIKTVTGAKAKSLKSCGVGANLGIELDGTVWSGGTMSIGGGPTIEGKTENKAGTTWEGSSDFVFAFRVRKVRVEQKTGTVNDDDDYTAGALLGNEVKKKGVPDLSISAEEDPKAEDEGFEEEELMEGDAVIFCAVPKVENQEEIE
ncbi:hypothetical protein G7Y89_g12088 [Cudoniella acicularis]|uniref:Uncharacterized protein n=1 Tax=Cudoniella acicularis TaxID=354080 RepID=A0A8H4RBW8_9HELO|nr:hypothetical protein G7Y89_g12088 [Cudoniella acicularis]